MKHLGFYILTVLFDEDGNVGDAEVEDANIFQDDTAVLKDGDAKYLNLYYHYNHNGWVDEETGQECGKWKIIQESTVNTLQEMWENREATIIGDNDFTGISTVIKFTDTCGNPMEQSEIVDEVEQGFKSINWYLYNHDLFILDYDRVLEEELPQQIDSIIEDIKKYKLLEDADGDITEMVAEMHD